MLYNSDGTHVAEQFNPLNKFWTLLGDRCRVNSFVYLTMKYVFIISQAGGWVA